MISLPYSKSKRYLTGVDWVLYALDRASKAATGTGNISQIVLALKGRPEPSEFRERIINFIQRYPITSGRQARDYNLAPYWKTYPSSSIQQRVKIHELEDSAEYSDILSILEQEMNQSFSTKKEHLVFHLLRTKDSAYVAMTFDHRLLDARGAEIFLNMFQQEYSGQRDKYKMVSLTEPAHLSRWKDKFEAGKKVNRAFQHFKKGSPAILPLPLMRGKGRFKFKIIYFSEDETSRIIERAYKQAGYLLVMPYMLAVSVQALRKILINRRVYDGYFVIPVSTDMRQPDKLQSDVFFNHISFFIFQVSIGKVGTFSDILDSIKDQMYDQVKSGLLQDIREASHLMRILPLPIMNNIMHVLLRGQVGTFCSSSIGDTMYTDSEFMGEDILNIFHMPRPPVPPGIGIYFNQFRGKLNATLSYINGILKEDEVNAIAEDMRSHARAQ